MKIFEQLINEGDLCFDVGANKGDKTDLMLSYGAKVICIEPQTSCVGVLNSKFANNDNVNVVCGAVGKENSTGKIYISNANTLSTMSNFFIESTSKIRFNGIHWGSEQDVEVITLDSLIEKYGTPKFCKIDIEGYEVEALKGLNSTIPFISIEFIPEMKSNTFECMSILEKIGTCTYNYSEAESMEFTFPDWKSSEEMRQFLLKNEDYRISFGDVYIKML